MIRTIPVAPPPEPPTFDARTRQPGRAWLAANPQTKGRRPKDLWSQFKNELAEGFQNRCGYTAMIDLCATVDHYLSCGNYWDQAYEWDNYRYVSAFINSSKKTADDSVLDPFHVGQGWFEIHLPSLQLLPTDAIPLAVRAKAEFTLKRLKLGDGEAVIRARQAWLDLYQDGTLSILQLRVFAPLIADAVERRQNGSAAP